MVFTFGPECKLWTDNMDYNLMFLKAVERMANDMLFVRKKLYLADLFREVGLIEWAENKRTWVMGWILPESYYERTCMPYISFDIEKVKRKKSFFKPSEEVLEVSIDCNYIFEKV